MRIGVISDTHVKTFDELPMVVRRALTDVDLIVHAGDITEMTVLDGLKALAEVKAVCGNMDSSGVKKALPQKLEFEAGGKKFGVVHGSGSPWGIARRVRELFTKRDIIIFGHSHQAFNEHVQGVLMFNPGYAQDSYGILTIGDTVRAEIIRV